MLKNTKKMGIAFIIIILLILGGSLYYVYFFTPKNALELYQEITFSNDYEEVKKYLLDGYEDNFSEEDFNYIKNNSADWIGQFSIFEYNSKSYIVMTTPGTERLKILAVEELPEELRGFFTQLSETILIEN